MKAKKFFEQCKRVLTVSTKPDKEEYFQSIKITGIGVIIIGLIGFLIFLAFTMVGGI